MPLPRQQQHASSVSDDGPLNVLGPHPQRSESACHLFPHGSNRVSNETTVFLKKEHEYMEGKPADSTWAHLLLPRIPLLYMSQTSGKQGEN